MSNCFLNSRLYPRSLVFHINQAQPFLLSFLSQIFSNCVLFKTISCKYCKIITFSEKKVLLQINSNCVLFRTINSKLSNCQTMPISERKIMLYKKFNFCPFQKKNYAVNNFNLCTYAQLGCKYFEIVSTSALFRKTMLQIISTYALFRRKKTMWQLMSNYTLFRKLYCKYFQIV